MAGGSRWFYLVYMRLWMVSQIWEMTLESNFILMDTSKFKVNEILILEHFYVAKHLLDNHNIFIPSYLVFGKSVGTLVIMFIFV